MAHLQLSQAMTISGSALAYKMGGIDNARFRFAQIQLGAGLGFWVFTKHSSIWSLICTYVESLPIAALALFVTYFGLSGVYLIIPYAIRVVLFVIRVVLPPERLEWLFNFPFVLNYYQTMDLMLYGGDPLPARVYLSDGAHGENLALFPLLEKRQHKRILVSDATCDPQECCKDLRKAISLSRRFLKCSFVPMDVHTQVDDRVDLEKAIGNFLESDRPYLRFLVVYDQEDQSAEKVNHTEVVYLKARAKFVAKHNEEFNNFYGCLFEFCNKNPWCEVPSLCGSFPHHFTSIQFFTPTQFDNYSKLGYQTAQEYFDTEQSA